MHTTLRMSIQVHARHQHVVISAITLAELEFGVACSGQAQAHNQAILDSLLEDILVAPFEALAARAYGPLRAADRDRTKDVSDRPIGAISGSGHWSQSMIA